MTEIKFPLIFQICLSENENTNDRYQKFGYEYVWDYFKGESMYNKSFVGWAGHTKNGSTFGSVDGNFEIWHKATSTFETLIIN